uniref:Uncharacterized protein LOC8268606 isoform X2 n=1 Tax=Rhizophora mucronata TaxID=61149 RepID=A0A2P2JU99_RHIMU
MLLDNLRLKLLERAELSWIFIMHVQGTLFMSIKIILLIKE